METRDAGKVHELRAHSPALEERQLWAQFRAAETTEAYYRGWLALQCREIGGVVAGLVVVAKGDGAFRPAAAWPEGRAPARRLVEAAERALRERSALALEVPVADAEPSTVLAHPFEYRGAVAGAVALDVAARAEADLERALRRLAWGAAWLELAARRAGRGDRLEDLLDAVAVPFEHERFRAAATAFATDLATRFGCDRVAVGFVEGDGVKLRALSHAAHFAERMNLTRTTEAMLEEAVDQGATVRWPAPDEPDAPVSRAHAERARQLDAPALCTLPFAHGTRFCGAVALERSGRPFDEGEVELLEAAVGFAGPHLEVLRRDDRALPVKVLESAREATRRLVGPRHAAWKLGAAVVVGVLLFALLATGTHRVTADASLEAGVLRAAVAPFEGYLAEAPVRAGDLVQEGQRLAVLDDRELALERARLASRLGQLEKQMRQALAEREAAQVRILSAQIDGARAQLEVVQDHLARTEVTAPFDGVVVSGDLSQKLGAPLQRGELLFEVAPLDAYRLVLQVDERDVDDLALGQQGALALAAFPDEPLPFEVASITPVSTPGEGSNTFRVEAILADASPRLRPGMQGVAKVEVGSRRLLWIWTHRAVDSVRLTLWKWLP